MGEVFLAEHRRMGRKVAVKVLRPQYSVDPGAVERLFNEARATSMISHPGIVQIFDCDIFEGRAYLVMEFLEGQSLRDCMAGWLHAEPDWPRVGWLGAQIASVLQAAHEKGIVHRDLKPDNVFLTQSRASNQPVTVKVLDFGIAKLRSAPAHAARLTGTGMLLGTPLYMSPEQCRGNGSIDERSDIYSLGCMLFEMLTGTPPFSLSSSGELIAAHLYQPAPLLTDFAPQAPRWLCDLVATMLCKAPDDRPQTMRHVEQALHAGDFSFESARAPVSNTLILPPTRQPAPPRESQHTTLGAAALQTTRSAPTTGRRWWGTASVLLAGASGLGLWAALSPRSERLPTPQPIVDVASSVSKTAAALMPDLVNARPDAAALAEDAAPAVQVTTPRVGLQNVRSKTQARTKRTSDQPFRGFDEL